MANKIEFNGAVKIVKSPSRKLISVRIDLNDKKTRSSLEKALGCNVPTELSIVFGTKVTVAWMSEDELLVLTTVSNFAKTFSNLTKNLKQYHCLILDISDSRVFFTVQGSQFRDLIAKGSPVDVSVEAFRVGDFRRSRLGMVAVAFWIIDTDSLEIMCFRSLEQFMFKWLCNAAERDSMPGYF